MAFDIENSALHHDLSVGNSKKQIPAAKSAVHTSVVTKTIHYWSSRVLGELLVYAKYWAMEKFYK